MIGERLRIIYQLCVNPLLSEALAPGLGQEVDILAVHEALEGLAALDERQARLAELRFFAGLTNPGVAGVPGVSRRPVAMSVLWARHVNTISPPDAI